MMFGLGELGQDSTDTSLSTLTGQLVGGSAVVGSGLVIGLAGIAILWMFMGRSSRGAGRRTSTTTSRKTTIRETSEPREREHKRTMTEIFQDPLTTAEEVAVALHDMGTSRVRALRLATNAARKGGGFNDVFNRAMESARS